MNFRRLGMRVLPVIALLLGFLPGSSGSAEESCFNPRTHEHFVCPKHPVSKRTPPSGIVAGGGYWLRELLREYRYAVAVVQDEVYQFKETLLDETLRPIVLLAKVRYYEILQASAAEQLASYARQCAVTAFEDAEKYSQQSHVAYQDFEDRWGAHRVQVRQHTTTRVHTEDGSPLEETSWVYVCSRRYPWCAEAPELQKGRKLHKLSRTTLLRANAFETEAAKYEAEAKALRR